MNALISFCPQHCIYCCLQPFIIIYWDRYLNSVICLQLHITPFITFSPFSVSSFGLILQHNHLSSKRSYYAHSQVSTFPWRGSTRLGLHASQKTFFFLKLYIAAAHSFALCLQRSILVPVSLWSPSWKAQSALIGFHRSEQHHVSTSALIMFFATRESLYILI